MACLQVTQNQEPKPQTRRRGSELSISCHQLLLSGGGPFPVSKQFNGPVFPRLEDMFSEFCTAISSIEKLHLHRPQTVSVFFLQIVLLKNPTIYLALILLE